MERRIFLKMTLPLIALLAGCRPRASVDCLSNSAEWLQRLRSFADPVLGKAAAQVLPDHLPAPRAVCAKGFAERYRQEAAADFAAGKIMSLEGWQISETEALIHRAVYLSDVQRGVGSGP